MNKPIVLICPNGIVKFYNSDGTRNEKHPTGFYNEKHYDYYKSHFIVNFSHT